MCLDLYLETEKGHAANNEDNKEYKDKEKENKKSKLIKKDCIIY